MKGYWKWLFESTIRWIVTTTKRMYDYIKEPTFEFIMWITMISTIITCSLSLFYLPIIFLSPIVLYIGISYAFYIDKK